MSRARVDGGGGEGAGGGFALCVASCCGGFGSGEVDPQEALGLVAELVPWWDGAVCTVFEVNWPSCHSSANKTSDKHPTLFHLNI